MLAKSFSLVVVLAVLTTVPVGTAVATSQEVSAQRKTEEQAAEKKLKDLDRNMNELTEESRRTGAQPREEINRLYEEFKEQQGKAREDLDVLRNATNEAWGKARENMHKAIENLNDLYERTRARFRDKRNQQDE